jgi:Xaa-Pro aminopeptidase
MSEIDVKIERLARVAHERALGGILVSRQSNFAWLSAGQSNRIDGSTDAGAGALFVAADGRRFLVANTIEMPRLRDEALTAAGFEPLEYPWSADFISPSGAVAAAQRVVGGAPIGSDSASADATDVAEAVASCRVPLVDAEIERYRQLGRDVAAAVESRLRSLAPGITERDAAVQVEHCVAEVGARAIVTLVAADDRIRRFRHPVPTTNVWRQTLLAGVCAERHGLVVALSRVLHHGAADRDLLPRTEATASVFASLVAATVSGTTGAELFRAAADAYRNAGFPGEELRHHQGGAIGYQSRDWIAHPESRHIVHAREAFAWNPSITGTKVEDTTLLLDDSTVDIITATDDWPAIEVRTTRGIIRASGVLVF